MARIVVPYVAPGTVVGADVQNDFLSTIANLSSSVSNTSIRTEGVTVNNIDWTGNPHYIFADENHDSSAGSYTFSTEAYTVVDNSSVECSVASIGQTLAAGSVVVMTASILVNPSTYATADDRYRFRFYMTYDTVTTTGIGPEFVHSISMSDTFVPVWTVNHKRCTMHWVYVHTGADIVLNKIALRASVQDDTNDIDFYFYDISVMVSQH